MIVRTDSDTARVMLAAEDAYARACHRDFGGYAAACVRSGIIDPADEDAVARLFGCLLNHAFHREPAIVSTSDDCTFRLTNEAAEVVDVYGRVMCGQWGELKRWAVNRWAESEP